METIALSSETAKSTAAFCLRYVIHLRGSPRRLISDSGRSFLACTVQVSLRACNIIHSPTTAYHPQTNGLTDRFNCTLSNMLSMYVCQDHSKLVVVLSFIPFVYNTAVLFTIAVSSFSLVHGREAVSTVDTTLLHRCHPIADAFVGRVTRRTEVFRQLACCRTIEQQFTAETVMMNVTGR